MTTATRKATVYTVIGNVPPGGISTSDSGGAQITNDVGDVQLQDPSGAVIVVSREDFIANWTVVTA